MKKAPLTFVLFSVVLLTSTTLIFFIRENKQLEKENEVLILKNDSMHVQQLKTKDQLDSIQHSLKTLSVNKNKKLLNLKR